MLQGIVSGLTPSQGHKAVHFGKFWAARQTFIQGVKISNRKGIWRKSSIVCVVSDSAVWPGDGEAVRPDGRPLSTGRSAQALAPQMQAKNITAVCRLGNSEAKLDMSRALEMIAGQRTRMLNQLSWKKMIAAQKRRKERRRKSPGRMQEVRSSRRTRTPPL